MQRPAVIAFSRLRPAPALALALACCGGDPADPTASAGTDPSSSTGDPTTPTDASTTTASTTTAPTTTDATTGDTAPAGEWQFVTLAEQTFPLNSTQVTVEFIRADRPDGGRSYLLYQHAPGANAPLVIQTQPYAGIDWTGEEVDARWAALGDGAHPDIDAPDPDAGDTIAYQWQDPAQAVGSNLVWAFNGFAVIHAYGRFYAGGDLADDVLDAVAPYAFARTRPGELDLERIGALGTSWGGMMALFGASQAPADAAPRMVVPISAPSDFADLWTWSTDTFLNLSLNPAMVSGFYSPYWRRAAPTIGSPPAGPAANPYMHSGLCPGLPGTLVVPHDSWDAIIPVTQTQDLAAACANVEPIYWPRATPLDPKTATMTHGPFAAEGLVPSVLIYTYAALVLALAPPEAPTVYSVASGPSLVLHLELVLAAQQAGEDVAWIVPRLRELADPRLQTLVAETNQLQPGAEVLASAVNQVWGTDFDADGLRAQLELGLPDPP